jgi:hypothetical protein
VTALARDIASIHDLERFHRAADVRFGRGLYGIANSDVGNRDIAVIGLPMGLGLMRNWHHTSDVDFVPHKFVQIQRLIIAMPESQYERLASPESPAQSQTKESGGIGTGSADGRTVRSRYLNVCNGQLLLGIGVLTKDRAFYGYRLCFVNGNEHRSQHTSERCHPKGPNHNLSLASHAVTYIL